MYDRILTFSTFYLPRPSTKTFTQCKMSLKLQLGHLKDSNAAAHSVDGDIFYVVINLSARSKSYILTFISYNAKLCFVTYNLSLYASTSCENAKT